jgi:predicted transcriptional regulator
MILINGIMGKKRFKDQILTEVLEACQGNGGSKTRIVYASEMNFETIKPYLALLIESGLLEISNNSPLIYKMTNKGERALQCLREIEELIPSFKNRKCQ